MKTSQKIILIVVAMITVLILITMIIVRDDIQLLSVKDEDWNFKTVAVDKFQALDFAANYHADVVSGLKYSVEVGVKDSTLIFPVVKTVGGTLYFSKPDVDSLVTNLNPIIKVRITMPLLKSVWGRRGSEITLRNFQSDSLAVNIETGCKFKGKDNTIQFLSFRTGDALVEWFNTP